MRDHHSSIIISGFSGTITSLLRHHRANANAPTYASSSLQETPLHLATQEGQERAGWLGEVLSVEVAALCTRVPSCGEETSNGWHEIKACCCDFNGGNRRTLALVAVIARLSGKRVMVALAGWDFAR
jgi:hypothetical protein